MPQRELIQINVADVLDKKLGAKSRFVPRALLRWIERTVCQDKLNELLRNSFPLEGAPFCDNVLAEMDVKVDVDPATPLPDAQNRRLLIVSNHPLGGLDGMALISLLTRHYGDGVKVVVNDILMAVDPLRSVFLPINKHGRQDREAIDAINAAMEGNDPVVVFPAGLVSRMGAKGEIKDLEWHKMFVAKAAQYHRDVLPIFFTGQNSLSFYKFARRRKRLGIKLNIEMVYLPRELVRSQGSRYQVRVGQIIPWQEFAEASDKLAKAQEIKEIVYRLKTNS